MADQKIQSAAPATPPPLPGALSKAANQDMLEPGENILTVVRRSVIGLVGIYLVAVVAVAAIFVLVVALAPGAFGSQGYHISAGLSVFIVLAVTLLGLILLTATAVYRQSRLLITDRSLVQILQKTLFNKKVSRLSMSNVEDVTEEQRGVLASIFNYGTLTVQTAGEEDNFVFPLCPNPSSIADRIIEARQSYVKKTQEKIKG